MPKDPANMNVRYEVIIQEDPETGDLLLPIPPEVLTSLGWKEGDDLNIDIREDGTFLIERIAK